LERHFGRVVIQVARGGVYSLDLYETPTLDEPNRPYLPGLLCRGYYVNPRPQVQQNPVPIRVELSLDDFAFLGIYEMFGVEGLPRDRDAPYSTSNSNSFRLSSSHPADVDLVFNAEVSAPLRLPDRTVWTGWLGGRGTGATREQINGQFEFILEQHGTIEPVTLLLVALFFAVFYDRDGRRQAEECYQQALSMCGDAGNIKSVNATSGATGMTLRRDSGCQIECFARWDPSDP